jgi:DNA polymerase-3 subunit epsilon
MIKNLAGKRLVFVDVETTGISWKHGARICEIGAAEIVSGEMTQNVFHRYINPGIEMPKRAFDVHGLSSSFLKNKPFFSDIVDDFKQYIDGADEIWAHNSNFDQGFIDFELARSDERPLKKFNCSLKLARSVKSGAKSNRLVDLADKCGYKGWSGRGAHAAHEDAKATAFVLLNLLLPLVTEKSLEKSKPSTPILQDGFTPILCNSDSRIYDSDKIDLGDFNFFAKGRPWSSDEDQKLNQAFISGANIKDIVKSHGRTVRALIMRLERNGIIIGENPYSENLARSSINLGR